ncbi:unnamed protein product [Haemonchus placei]|uniref:Uncharacterized protein n=1 Tax=Haemonchus placei TaxID=6290 RepID=A0A3P7XA08_HAEPC|nr:unnamed protein product [Haemonchus placei]
MYLVSLLPVNGFSIVHENLFFIFRRVDPHVTSSTLQQSNRTPIAIWSVIFAKFAKPKKWRCSAATTLWISFRSNQSRPSLGC